MACTPGWRPWCATPAVDRWPAGNRGPGERSFSRGRVLLEQASRYVARGLEVPSAGLVAGEFVERRDRRAVLSLDADGRLCHLSPDALKMLLLSHGDVTPDNVGRTHRRGLPDALAAVAAPPSSRRAGPRRTVVITVENAWGRFVYERARRWPLGEGAAPMLHVGIRQQEPYGLGRLRAPSTRCRCRLRSARSALLHVGRSTTDIAASLSISPATVADHVKKIYALDVHSVHELSARIHRQVAARVA